MARISNELASARETYAYDRFAEGASASQVNEELAARDGLRMNLSRLYALSRAAQDRTGIPAKVKATSKKTTKKATKKTTKRGKSSRK